MNKSTLFGILLCIAFLGCGWYSSAIYKEKSLTTHENKQNKHIDTTYVVIEKEEVNWNAFINALIHIESKGKWDAVGTSNDVGVLQITPICVEQANIYVGYDKYSLDDRLDSLKSVEIFNVIQNKMNPTHDLHFALKIWNSKAPISYHTQVMGKYEEIKK
jgi:hypothetical protein